MKDGEGVMTENGVGQYIGQWSRNKRHGHGREKRPDGTDRAGEWIRGKFQDGSNGSAARPARAPAEPEQAP